MKLYTHDKHTGVVTVEDRRESHMDNIGFFDFITMFTVEVHTNEDPTPPRIEQTRPELKLC